ncbi:DUF5085 family protein [Lactovum odontotermitis]
MEIPFEDVKWEEKIAFQNVLSFREKFYYEDLEDHFKSFISKAVEADYSLKGPFFYSLNNFPKDKMVDIEMFFPVYENKFENADQLENFHFHSYFEIGPVFKGIVTGNFETQTERIYAELLETLETNQLEINTPFFHIPARDGSKYAYIYLGYASQEVLDEANRRD